MKRQAVTLEALFEVLNREFTKVRPAQCLRCITPYPVRKAPADDVSTNWFIVEPEDCPHHCRNRLAEIVTRLMSEYELERSVYSWRATE